MSPEYTIQCHRLLSLYSLIYDYKYKLCHLKKNIFLVGIYIPNNSDFIAKKHRFEAEKAM